MACSRGLLDSFLTLSMGHAWRMVDRSAAFFRLPGRIHSDSGTLSPERSSYDGVLVVVFWTGRKIYQDALPALPVGGLSVSEFLSF